MKTWELFGGVLAVVLLSACGGGKGGGNILAPSTPTQVAGGSSGSGSGEGSAGGPGAPGGVAPVPPSLPPGISIPVGPRGVLPDCLHASALSSVVEWRIAGVSEGSHVTKGYSHEAGNNCDSTSVNLRTDNQHLRFRRAAQTPTILIVEFDKDVEACGRVQVDISVDGVNVLGEVVDYGKACEGDEPPPPPADCVVEGTCVTPPPPPTCEELHDCPEPSAPPVPPTPPNPKWQNDAYCGFEPLGEDLKSFPTDGRVLASDGTEDGQEQGKVANRVHSEWCDGKPIHVDVVGNTAFLDVKVASVESPTTVTFIAYQKDGIHLLPQKFLDGHAETFTLPGLYIMSVKGLGNSPNSGRGR